MQHGVVLRNKLIADLHREHRRSWNRDRRLHAEVACCLPRHRSPFVLAWSAPWRDIVCWRMRSPWSQLPPAGNNKSWHGSESSAIWMQHAIHLDRHPRLCPSTRLFDSYDEATERPHSLAGLTSLAQNRLKGSAAPQASDGLLPLIPVNPVSYYAMAMY